MPWLVPGPVWHRAAVQSLRPPFLCWSIDIGRRGEYVESLREAVRQRSVSPRSTRARAAQSAPEPLSGIGPKAEQRGEALEFSGIASVTAVRELNLPPSALEVIRNVPETAHDTGARFCVLRTPDVLSRQTRASLCGRKAVRVREFAWSAADVIRVKFLEGDPQLQAKVREAAKQWTAPGMANLTLSFVPTDQPADIRIGFQPGAGSWSYIGTLCRSVPDSQPTMNFGWLTAAASDEDIVSVALHEFGHALGLAHEHQNPTQPIHWNMAAVRRDLSGPPNFWDDATIQRNIFDRYDPEFVDTTEVDARSIMIYPIPASWTLDGFSTEFNSELSPADKLFIKQCYP
jgi:hypothetical protein